MATDHPISIETSTIHHVTRAFVSPPIIGIGQTAGDTVTWTNSTDAKARLWFPNGGRVFNPTTSVPPVPNFSNPIDIPASGGTFQVAIKAGPDHGYYKYSVYCEDVQVHDFAQGNSEPGLHVP